ncbi:MAG: DUF4113 domain-containing protein [Cyanobacteria bacterium J06627_28]
MLSFDKIKNASNTSLSHASYTLYGDMSRRVMYCLSRFTPDMEVYSIDEAFLGLDGFSHLDLTDYSLQMQRYVFRATRIPISVGIGPTKTLAKLANRIAKNRQRQADGNGVFNLCDRALQNALLPTISVNDVWGIGKRWSAKLQARGIATAAQLRDTEPGVIRQMSNVVLERTVYELQGISCLGLEDIQPKKQIMCSRSFGRLVTSKSDLLEAISCHGARVTEKLRQQQSRAGGLYVFLKTNRFSINEPQYQNSITFAFSAPTGHTGEVISAARAGLQRIFCSGFRYQKCGVMLMDIAPANIIQCNLFCQRDHERDDRLMRAIDQLNSKMGTGTVEFAAQGIRRDWQMRQAMRSPRYTTRLAEAMIVKC